MKNWIILSSIIALGVIANALEVKAPSPNAGTITPAAISVSTITVDTNTLKTSEGKVGIGEAAPLSKLHITDANYGEIVRAGSGANRIGIGVNSLGAGYCGGVYVGGTLGATFCNGGLRLGSTVTNPPSNTIVTPSAIIETSESPASGAACTAGQITWDASYIYVCTASGAWKRAALTGGY